MDFPAPKPILRELHKVLEKLAGMTTFSAGAELARELWPSSDLEEAQTWMKQQKF